VSYAPNDLVTDKDLLGYERTILTQFGMEDWQARRQKAISDWLFPLLESRGYSPLRLRTRHSPAEAVGYTSATYTDRSSAAGDADGLVLSTILASTSDRLYLGFAEPFHGISVRMLDSVNAVSANLSLDVWADGWVTPDDVEDGTRLGMASFAKGGAITWTSPDALVQRTVNSQGPCYWARLSLSGVPTTGTAIGPVTLIRRSRLCAAVTCRTLALIFREAPIGQDGPWERKAEWYEAEAERAWLRVADRIGGEFDTDGDDAIDRDEAVQTAESVSGGLVWERA
jgi:hypothetical protein